MLDITIIAPAAIPWLTGTSINPLLRAVHLSKSHRVTLTIPWIIPQQQSLIFPHGLIFTDKNSQEEYIRSYIDSQSPNTLVSDNFNIVFYQARYTSLFGCICPTQSLSRYLSQKKCYVILEEPGHLLFFQPFTKLQFESRKIIGITHTNYQYYINSRAPNFAGKCFSRFFQHYVQRLSNRACQKIIDVSQPINGVIDSFFSTKKIMSPSENKIYFAGKILWEKGFKELIDLAKLAGIEEIDIFGSGSDEKNILDYAKNSGVKLNFLGVSTHIVNDLTYYKLFINCSRSENFCTTTAEALAMGKFVILPRCKANDYFYQFQNCLPYSNKTEFLNHIAYAKSNQPKSDSTTQILSWQNATNNLTLALRTLNDAKK